MDRDQFIEICNKKVKLVRAEYSFSQDKMAFMLGISKKTLVEIEKGRSSLGWTGSVALCALFGDSEVIDGICGDNPLDLLAAIAFDSTESNSKKTIGNTVFWQTIKENEYYLIQQNVVSQHYRLIDRNAKRIASALNLEDLAALFEPDTQ